MSKLQSHRSACRDRKGISLTSDKDLLSTEITEQLIGASTVKLPSQNFSQVVRFNIGLGASTFLVVRIILAQISPNFPKKLLCDFCLQIFSYKSHEDLFLV